MEHNDLVTLKILKHCQCQGVKSCLIKTCNNAKARTAIYA